MRVGAVVAGGERVVLSVVICDVRDARVGSMGADGVGVVVERPRLPSTAVRRSEMVAREVRVDGWGWGEGSGGAGSRRADCEVFSSFEASVFDPAASFERWAPRNVEAKPFSIWLSASTPSSTPWSSSSFAPSPFSFSFSLLCNSDLTSSASLFNLASFLPRLSSSLSLSSPS